MPDSQNLKTILIVDDDPIQVKLLDGILSNNNFSTLTSTDAAEGLQKAMSQYPDLIILDVMMPLMDGIAVLDELRKDTYGKTAKVVLLTNFDLDNETVKKIVKNKPSLYLIKSNIEPDKLMKKIESLLHND